jgi:hypothetical protein
MKSWAKWTVIACAVAVVAAYLFWDGYQPSRSVAAGFAALYIGAFRLFWETGCATLPSDDDDGPPVTR